MSQTIASYLDECFGLYFEPLISALSLAGLRREIQGMGGLYEAHGTTTAVRLVNDRGCINFDVYCLSQPSLCWCDVELLSELLEPPNAEEPGIRRLDLEHQADLLRKHWMRIEQLFAPETAHTTKSAVHNLGLKRSRKMFR